LHSAEPERAMCEIGPRLRSNRATLPGEGKIVEHYKPFQNDRPHICAVLALETDRLTFLDLSKTITSFA
jgi:hypothetical protein